MKSKIIVSVGLCSFASLSHAITVQVEFTAATPNIGLSPLGVAFHDGGLQTFGVGDQLNTLGERGSNLEFLAERGNPAGLLTNLSGQGTPISTGQLGGPTAPGGTSVFTVDVAAGQSQFSFFSMVLPSNDWFVGTESDESVDISSLLSGGTDAITINLETVYDAGTELNNFVGAGGSGLFPFFSTSSALGDEENGLVTVVDRSSTNPFALFENSLGNQDIGIFSPLNFGGITEDSLGSIRLTVVPEPSTGLLATLATGLLVIRRKR